MVFPLVMMAMGRVTCPHCGQPKVALRATLAIGQQRICEVCRRSYTVQVVEPALRGKVKSATTKARRGR